MYHPSLVQPMRDELTVLGFEELQTAEGVDRVLKTEHDTVLVVVNSVCGCAASGCRPGVAMALNHSKVPSKLATVFAGQDIEATERLRTYFTDIPPSSPAVALLKEGQLLAMLERQDIEGKSPLQIAEELTQAFDEHC
jgi:putative YphP/YqiW family bacilliredoxin